MKSSIIILALVGCVAAVHASPQFKTRALWVSPEGFATAAAADQTLERCARAGINTILPNVLCYGNASFRSTHFRGRVLADDRHDPLAYLLRKAHGAGIQVQAWCCVFYEGSGKPLRPEWEVRSFDGRPFDKVFLSPGHPEVNPYLLSVISDLLAYDIDGIHLDYIRYPGTAYDYSEPARKTFQAAKGFDPQNFLDGAERIVPPEKDPYPIRVLHPLSHVEKVWETTALERDLDQAGVGFGFISETVDSVQALRIPGLLILSSWFEVSPRMLEALSDYVRRGGDLLWSDLPTPMLRTNALLRELTGLAGGEWKAKQPLRLQATGSHALTRLIPSEPLRATVNCATEWKEVELIAKLESGRPAVTLHRYGKGQVLALGFDVMESTSGPAVELIRNLVSWFRTQAGVTGPDLLGAKRAEWIHWRGDQVTDLVRAISKAAKRVNSKWVITSSGGTNPSDFFACYRDSRRWLAEGSNDVLFPMNYTLDPVELEEMLEAQDAWTPPGKQGQVFPGLQIYAARVANGQKTVQPADAAVVDKELRTVQARGIKGSACSPTTT